MNHKIRNRIFDNLSELDSDLDEYSTNLRKIFSRKLTRPHDCREYFFNIFSSLLKIYVDYMDLVRLEREWCRIKEKDTDKISQIELSKIRESINVVKRELDFREKFKKAIKSLPCWSRFDSFNPFADENLLFKQEDYINNLALHLPEIYGEVIAIKRYIKESRNNKSNLRSFFTEIMVSLQHLTHHISYCHYVLEKLSDEFTWK